MQQIYQTKPTTLLYLAAGRKSRLVICDIGGCGCDTSVELLPLPPRRCRDDKRAEIKDEDRQEAGGGSPKLNFYLDSLL